MKGWIWRWGPAVLIMLIIFIASGTPGNEIPGFGAADFIVKKGGHMFVYALLAIAYSHAMGKGNSRYGFTIAVCLAILYAASDEFHQKFTPGRNASFWDVCFDAAGAFIGLKLWCYFQTRRSNRQKATNL
jgi:VanZ family protein